MKLYIARHGQDEEGYLGGWSQRGLVSEGVIQANKLALHLKQNQSEYSIQRIVCSDLPRAVMTAEIVAQELSLQVEKDSNFREMNNGDLAGISIQEAKKKYPGLYFSALDMTEAYPGGESPKAFYERVKTHFEESINALKQKTTLLITHGGVINILWHYIVAQPWSNKTTACKAENCSLFVLDLESMTFDTMNQTDFLED